MPDCTTKNAFSEWMAPFWDIGEQPEESQDQPKPDDKPEIVEDQLDLFDQL